jgi:hypothetical protein
MSANVEITRHGFVYGSAHVERIGEHPAGYAALHISGGRGKWIEVFVSPGGDSIRVYDQDGNELTAPALAAIDEVER